MAYWVAVILLAQMAFIPVEGLLCGVMIPNILQIAMPVALLIGLGSFLIAKRRQPVTAADFLIIGLGLWGLIGMYVTPGWVRWKWYTNRFIYPMGFYYLMRLIPLDHRKLRGMLAVNCVAVGLQSLLMVLYRRIGFNPLYPATYFNTKRVSAGPFDEPYTAAPYLAAWSPLFVYLAATSSSKRVKMLAYAGLVLNLFAITCTTQRAATMAALLSIAFLALAPRLRGTILRLVLGMCLLYVVASDSDMVAPVSTRLSETDQSREAYNRVGWNIVRSPFWNPFFGVGFQRSRDTMPKLEVADDDETLTVWGNYELTVSEFAQYPKPLHNLYLSLLVEFGLGGVILGLGILVALAASLVRYYSAWRRGEPVDLSLAVALCAGIVSVLAIGKYHNIYIMYAPLSVLWTLYGALVGRPDAVRFGGTGERTGRAGADRSQQVRQRPDHARHREAKGQPEGRLHREWKLPPGRLWPERHSRGAESSDAATGEVEALGPTHRQQAVR